VSFHLRIGDREIIPVNRDEPVGLEVGFPLVLDHMFHHLPEGFGFGLDLLEFSVEGGSGGVMVF